MSAAPLSALLFGKPGEAGPDGTRDPDATALEPCLRAIRRSHPSSVPRAQTRGFRIKHSRRAHYDPVEFFALYEVTELFNSGRALEPGSACFTDAVAKVAKRAIAARKGRKVGIREYNTVRNGVVREAHS